MKALCIGESILEITSQMNDVVIEGNKYRLEEKIECGGGHAGNVAYLLGKWGVETYIASMMGADDAASKIKKEYENIGVKTDYIETSYDKQTGISLVLINKTNINKTLFEIVSNSYLKKYLFAIEPDIIIADGNDFNATVQACDKFPKALSFLMVNRNNNEILELCKYVKYIVFNKDSAEEITNMKIDYDNSSSLVNLYNKLKQKYNNSEIVITLGERGAVYSVNSQIKIMPPIKMNIVDTNGAGDAFMGAFSYSIGRGFDLEKAITYATIAASMSTTKLTSRLSIPSITEVSGYYDSRFGGQSNQNNVDNNQNVNMNITANDNIPKIEEVKNDNQQNA